MGRDGGIECGYYSRERVGGLTHSLYRYPARFSPLFARAALEAFSVRDDLVLDPFLGGGTTAVEALATGRRFVGIDINALSTVLARAKTTPMSRREALELERWAGEPHPYGDLTEEDERLRGAPDETARSLLPFRAAKEALSTERLKTAAGALLAHTGQWALDGRQVPASRVAMLAELHRATVSLISGLSALANSSRAYGFPAWSIARRCRVFEGQSQKVALSRQTNRFVGRVSLVLTSPPYPGMHVLYHRWQVRGRTETPMPYWLVDGQDGLGPRHYTMGSRSVFGEAAYFHQLQESWTAVTRLLRPRALVVQLVSFKSVHEQLPRFLDAMAAAGYVHRPDLAPSRWREVPNRRWYYRVAPRRAKALELLLVHQVNEIGYQ